MGKTVCKICIAKKGLLGADLIAGKCDYAFDDEESFMKHLREEHNIAVKKHGKIIN